MGCLRAFLIFLLMISTFVWLLLLDNQTITQPTFVNRTLAKSGLYSEAPKILSDITANMSKENQVPPMALQIIAQATQPAVLQSQVENFVTGFLNYYKGKTKSLTVNFNAAPYKKTIGANVQIDADTVKSLLDSLAELPACPAGSNSDQMMADSGCRPPDIDVAALNSQIKSGGGNVIDQLPDNVNIGPFLTKSNPQIEKTKARFHQAQIAFLILTLLEIVLIGVLFWLSWPDLRAFFRRAGIGLFVPSLILLIGTITFFYLPPFTRTIIS